MTVLAFRMFEQEVATQTKIIAVARERKAAAAKLTDTQHEELDEAKVILLKARKEQEALINSKEAFVSTAELVVRRERKAADGTDAELKEHQTYSSRRGHQGS